MPRVIAMLVFVLMVLGFVSETYSTQREGFLLLLFFVFRCSLKLL